MKAANPPGTSAFNLLERSSQRESYGQIHHSIASLYGWNIILNLSLLWMSKLIYSELVALSYVKCLLKWK